LQLRRYHPDTIEFFDIGNHLELAGRLLARPQYDPAKRRVAFNVETNKAVYIAANGGGSATNLTDVHDDFAPLPSREAVDHAAA
jgi:hypothetical protein